MHNIGVPPSTVDLSSDLVTYAARLVRAVRRAHHLPAGFRVLSLLDEHGALGISALAEIDRCSQPTMSTAIRDLVEQGWVSRSPHPTDARSTVVALTRSGHAEIRRVRRLNGEAIAARLATDPTHSPESLATAVDVLRGLLDTSDTERRTL